ncbi:hypothetical protein ACPPVU_12250 [Mucilaginibacter sp. McL0603]|uniref:hypothetical protein n=1 Tax=Mucilaginibacter sp. McL0603 TaxID=3415670 RepID=UPI003CEC0377
MKNLSSIMHEITLEPAMFVVIATLIIRVMVNCISSCLQYFAFSAVLLPAHTPISYRTKNQIIHDRKFALFPGGSRQLLQKEQKDL